MLFLWLLLLLGVTIRVHFLIDLFVLNIHWQIFREYSGRDQDQQLMQVWERNGTTEKTTINYRWTYMNSVIWKKSIAFVETTMHLIFFKYTSSGKTRFLEQWHLPSDVTVTWPDVWPHRSDVLQNEACREVDFIFWSPSEGVGQLCNYVM